MRAFFLMSFLIISHVLCGAASDERKPKTTDDFVLHMCKKGIFETVPPGYMLPGDADALSSSASSFSDSISGDELDDEIPGLMQEGMLLLQELYKQFIARSAASRGHRKAFVGHVVDFLDEAFKKGALFSNLRGRDINVPDYRGYRLLHFAVMQNNGYVTKTLLDQGADARALSDAGYTPLHTAAIVDLGFQSRAFLDYVDKKNTFEGILSALLKKVDIDAPNELGRTPMHQAVLHDNQEMILFLADKGATVDAEDKLKQTPLFLAFKRKNAKNAAALIQLGARQDHRDKFGSRPIDMIQNPLVRVQFKSRLENALKEGGI